MATAIFLATLENSRPLWSGSIPLGLVSSWLPHKSADFQSLPCPASLDYLDEKVQICSSRLRLFQPIVLPSKARILEFKPLAFPDFEIGRKFAFSVLEHHIGTKAMRVENPLWFQMENLAGTADVGRS